MAIIKAPNKEYTGFSASVFFVNGEGQTDNSNLIEWFREKGYTVLDKGEQVENQNYNNLTVDELKGKLDELGIEYNSKDKKDDLIRLLNGK